MICDNCEEGENFVKLSIYLNQVLGDVKAKLPPASGGFPRQMTPDLPLPTNFAHITVFTYNSPYVDA